MSARIARLYGGDRRTPCAARAFATGGDGDRQVSLLMGERAEAIRQANGLCTARFSADIVTQGLSYAALTPGMRLTLGGCTLVIVQQGKRCFDECALHAAGASCGLPTGCAFARVETGGRICEGDEIVF